MKAAILTTGDEVVTGRIVDTNEAFIARQLDDLGLDITENRAIPDDSDKFLSTLLELVANNDIVVVTGGLGPTEDDLTAKTVAQLLDCELVYQEDAVKRIKERYAKRGLSVTDIALKQALYPQDAKPILNSIGMAVAFRIDYQQIPLDDIALDGAVFCLPGVPAEMKDMMEKAVLVWVKEFLDRNNISKPLAAEFFIYGLPESVITKKYMDSGLATDKMRFAINFKEGIADVRLFPDFLPDTYSEDTNVDIVKKKSSVKKEQDWFDPRKIRKTMDKIYKGHLLPERFQTLSDMAHHFLIEENKTISFVESCTGGGLAYKMTDRPGASKYLKQSFVTYSNESKKKLVGVDPKTLEKYGAVSKQTVQEMAIGLLHVSGSDFAVAISGIAGPDGGTAEKPVGTVCIGIAQKGIGKKPKHLVKDYLFPGNREMVRLFSIQSALYQLLRFWKKL